jgi:hypothetical protein
MTLIFRSGFVADKMIPIFDFFCNYFIGVIRQYWAKASL